MSDLIERLRGYRFPIDPKRQMTAVLDCKNAADRIEALEAALRKARPHIRDRHDLHDIDADLASEPEK